MWLKESRRTNPLFVCRLLRPNSTSRCSWWYKWRSNVETALGLWRKYDYRRWIQRSFRNLAREQCSLCQCHLRSWAKLHATGTLIHDFMPVSCFPECVARVPVSLWESGGWGCVRSTLRSRPQPFATVRNRPREDRMAVPMVSSAGGVIFGGFQRFVASFRVAGVALCDIKTCSVTRRKSFCVAGAILLRRFQEMRGSFR